MARADEMLLCANCQANVFVLTQEEEADRHRERERRGENRPGFDRHDFIADILVLFDENRAVDDLVPDGRIVGPVDNVNLDFDRAR